ncbi:MAG: EpsI family protein [Methyloversatilis sp.]|uniref:exosortase-associated protein EpsI, B-type n=1 Tax=Methyloversatilis sp. TaxID=2569862 RepID=UPI0027338002|nr:exosortase-associated protein EpsI, B-type [Methyloversatilis sp.]MDP2867935.1 EpsI family protein [Methyloversatilis sp.]
MKKSLISALAAAVLMTSAAAIATVMTPTRRIVDTLPKLDIEASIPQRFGDWQIDARSGGGVVNPQQTELLDKLYSQIVTRTYVNSEGYRIMLSIAYGEDQRDGNQLHYPEVCYPAQGFQVTSNKKAIINTSLGELPIKRLESHLSQQRYEPITYWTTVGSTAVVGGKDKKIAEMRYGLRGEIPDGLLFRVSSIDRETDKAFVLQEAFIKQLLSSLSVDARKRLAGI